MPNQLNHVKEQYAALGVDVDQALKKLATIPISMHCWQGDDLAGFEGAEGITDGGIMTTGSYPGRARNADELRHDIEKVFSLVPGSHRIALHAIYAETGGKQVSREKLLPEHFSRWIDWGREKGEPLKKIVPEVGWSRAPSMFANVVFPHPEGPIRVINSFF